MANNVLFQFNWLNADLQIVSDEQDVFLEVSNQIKRDQTKLSFPKPGPYDTSTPTSTYDTRGEITISFQVVNQSEEKVIVKASIRVTGEDWHWGSDDDAWHDKETHTYTVYLLLRLDDRHRVACQELSASEASIQANLLNKEWMRSLATIASLPFQEIMESYHYSWEDGKEPEESVMHYPQKGIPLYSYVPAEPKRPRPKPGSAFPGGWFEKHEVYLLDTGQISTVERMSSEYCRKTSLIHDESGKDVNTKIRLWGEDEIKKNGSRIAKELQRVINRQ